MSKIILKTGRRKTTVPRRVILQAVRDAVSSTGGNQENSKGIRSTSARKGQFKKAS